MTATAIMPLVAGLATEGAYQYPPSVMNTVCAVNAAQLVATPGGPLIANNPIDKYLSRKLPGAVRLFFGRGPGYWMPTQAWLDLGGVTVYDPVDGKTSTVTRWWDGDVQAAQRDLVQKLAAKYDGQISLVFIANGGSTYAEPFIRGIASPQTRHALLDAGYTATADQASYTAGYQMFSAFKQTRLAQAFNPWQGIRPDGSGYIDVAFTIAMVDAFCAKYPRRAVLQNNSIRIASPAFPNWPGKDYQQMYDHMRLLHQTTGRAIRFQTATKQRVGSFAQTLGWALSYGAHAVELSPGFQDCTSQPCLTSAQMTHYDGALRANAAVKAA